MLVATLAICGWACGGKKRQEAADMRPGPRSADTSGAPDVVEAGPLEITLAVLSEEDTLGRRFGISAPMVRVTLRNVGAEAFDAPRQSPSLRLSLMLRVAGMGQVGRRGAGTGKRQLIETSPLFPGEAVTAELCPLQNGPGYAPLEPGAHEVSACVRVNAEQPNRTTFAETFGGQCSNPVTIRVTRVPPTNGPATRD